MIKSIYSNLLPKAVLLSVFLSPGYVISKAHANTDSISGIEQTNGKLSGRVIDAKENLYQVQTYPSKAPPSVPLQTWTVIFPLMLTPIKYSPSVLSDMKQKQSLSPTRKH